ncbi:hypothetical protein MAR_031789 [Mya arenaria]|uniref:DUF4430 domain-containing protein n=1 Tax=Mya arenaria TaxID=6604 RepID=A0ABY7F4T4_MYAAR|nr:hypothetical protein MAR_031789 [Mya arenaria]
MHEISSLVATQANKASGQFRYAVRNGVYAPTFNYEQDMDLVGNNTLVYYMNKACDIYPDTFTNYSATYFPSFGYFIDAINGVAADWDADKSYWRILNFSQPLSVGDEIIFNLTVYEEQQSTEHDAPTEAPTNMSSAPTYISSGATLTRSSASVITTTSTPATTTTTTSVTGPKFRYTVLNMMVKPYFSHSVHLRIEDKQPLIYYMEKACDKYQKKFRKFTVSFLQSFSGYFVDAINDVFGNWYENETFWLILNETGPVALGVSSYIPTPGDDITFRFVHGNDYLPNHNKTSQPPNTCNCSCNVPIGGQPLTKQPSPVTPYLYFGSDRIHWSRTNDKFGIVECIVFRQLNAPMLETPGVDFLVDQRHLVMISEWIRQLNAPMLETPGVDF